MSADIGQKLQKLRKARDLTQVEVAAELGVGRSTITGVERGNDPPSRELLFKLAAFYEVSVDELYSGTLGHVPEAAKPAKDDDELSLLLFWRDLDEAQKRRFLLRLVRGSD